ncbi:Uncharacterised protein [Lysinibacillus capsici]|uniref:DUF2971 domain-containing protein n=1 Tax=Lysinibacillus capsici TaxID=2115968 RepID=A0A2X0XMV5_9BACI|nr:DUF2971 domain-containing protein [Lysinibacillus capsici]SPT99196.1 Uncharacterised protein [Lysinibacillus capsici]
MNNNYNATKWLKRHRNRNDISAYLTHLTKPQGDLNSVEVLIKILKERKLLGSGRSGFIKGSEKAVCFQDAPLNGIGQNVLHEERMRKEFGGKIRYQAIGLMFSKPYIFKNGGRPVIYEDKELASELFDEVSWRVVTMDFNDLHNIIDWSHEREWRMKGDFEFELSKVYVVLTNRNSYNYFIKKVPESILKEIKGIVTIDAIIT